MISPKFVDTYQDGDIKLEVRHYDGPPHVSYWVTAGVAAIQLDVDGINTLYNIMTAYIDDGDSDE